MGFGQVALGAVELGQSSRATFDREPKHLESLKESPAGGIDGSRILERGFDLGQNACEHVRLVLQKLADILRCLGSIARLAS